MSSTSTKTAKPPRKIPFTLKLDPEILRDLKRASKKTGLTMTEIIERSVSHGLALFCGR